MMDSMKTCIVIAFTAVLLQRVNCMRYNRTVSPPSGVPFLIQDGQTLQVLVMIKDKNSTDDDAMVEWEQLDEKEPTELHQLWVKNNHRVVYSAVNGNALCAVQLIPEPKEGYTHQLRVLRQPKGCYRWQFGLHQIYCDDWSAMFWYRRHTHYVLLPWLTEIPPTTALARSRFRSFRPAPRGPIVGHSHSHG